MHCKLTHNANTELLDGYQYFPISNFVGQARSFEWSMIIQIISIICRRYLEIMQEACQTRSWTEGSLQRDHGGMRGRVDLNKSVIDANSAYEV